MSKPGKSRKDQLGLGDALFGTRLGEARDHSKRKPGTDLFIVDNSDQDWKVREYLHDWCQLSKSIDVATGFFEIGALLALADEWQKVDLFRILMGNEVSLRTKRAFEQGLGNIATQLDLSVEEEKERDDFLGGVPAIVEAIKSGKIQCKVYRESKFHAKAYITHARQEVVGSYGLVGSSNFTLPGLSNNVELNVQITGSQVKALQDWYESHWAKAEDVSPGILRVIERHTRDYPPFEVYVKALQEFFRGHEITESEWEQTESKMLSVLDQYQKEGYWSLVKIARQYGGALLCDGVGLGKTFVGLMLIERLIMHDRKRVVLFVPKSIRKDVWERDIRRYLPDLWGDFSNLAVFNHTDLSREGEFPERFEKIAEMADAVVIDEAHHFRNPGIRGRGEKKPSRYWKLFDLLGGSHGVKQIYMLTATPINNQLDDLRHMIELFSRQREDYFRSTLGIHSLRGHFITMERELRKKTDTRRPIDEPVSTDTAEAEKVLGSDNLFRALVVQRSRAYVRQSQIQEGGRVTAFPKRHPPQVAKYSVRRTYGKLLDDVDKAFRKERALFVLGIYYPLYYYKGPDETIDPLVHGRQKQVVSLIRTQFLKRFESSASAFESSCDRLLLKLLAWATKHSETESERRRLERWKEMHSDLINHVHSRQLELWGEDEDIAELEEDVISDEMLEGVDYLSREDYRVEEILNDTILDLDQIALFLDELRRFRPEHDDKLQALIKLLKTDPVLKTHKVIIFSEFADTARYLKKQLQAAGIEGVEQIDSGTKVDRGTVIRRFAPYYNDSSSSQLKANGRKEIRVLISTDILAEGLNLQDATRLINYDLHWNPVRLMQRIGRVDRRMNPENEARITTDHPEQESLRGEVAHWNFLPPDDLNQLLHLYQLVSHKTLRISKTFGIEGKKLLTETDDYDALRNFNETYEGTTTLIEEMHLEYRRIIKEYPELVERLKMLPGRVFTGKEHPSKGAEAVFFCYRLPRPDYSFSCEDDEHPWTEEAGETKWYLYDLDTEAIHEEPAEIINVIRSTPETPRICRIEKPTLTDIRKRIEKHIKNTYLKRVQAPIGVKATLRAWMELS